MLELIWSVRKIICLVIVALVLFVALGLYFALSAAPSYTLSASGEAATASDTESTSFGAVRPAARAGSTAQPSSAAGSSEPIGADNNTALEPSPSDGSGAVPAPSNSTPKPGAGSSDDGNGGGNTSAPGSPPASPEPQKTFHPAWYEWVEDGHFEDVAYPATYGERPVYGAVCSECGQVLSENPNQHLKQTHHLGWHEGIVGYETYEITPARTVREWVDTSHWVHHEGYWE